MNKSVHIMTYGCQMNRHDSEIMAGVLTRAGYRLTQSPEKADVILVNTCSVRKGAEERVLARFGELKSLKKKKPDLKLGICGCMAQRYGKSILEKNLGIDLVVGPDDYAKLPDLLGRLNGSPALSLNITDRETYAGVEPVRTEGLGAWISIMRGCDNFCTYCIVPFLRGRERSLATDEILSQVRNLPAGVKEITLLGQNVNSYRDGDTTFARLLEAVSREAGGRRIRFTSSHPKDFTDDIIEIMAARSTICSHVHLALQSGSDRVLKAMNRHYTVDDYLTITRKVREAMPDAGLQTDIIVGFPGEKEEDFQQTLEAVRAAEFDNAFTFKYSPRPGTRAAELEDSVPGEVKQERLSRLIDLQRKISDARSRALMGRTFEVLLEGESKKSPDQWSGRTGPNRVVILPREDLEKGMFINAKIMDAGHLTLFGERTI